MSIHHIHYISFVTWWLCVLLHLLRDSLIQLIFLVSVFRNKVNIVYDFTVLKSLPHVNYQRSQPLSHSPLLYTFYKPTNIFLLCFLGTPLSRQVIKMTPRLCVQIFTILSYLGLRVYVYVSVCLSTHVLPLSLILVSWHSHSYGTKTIL